MCLCRLYNNNVNLFRKGCGRILFSLPKDPDPLKTQYIYCKKIWLKTYQKQPSVFRFYQRLTRKRHKTIDNSGAWIRLKKMQFPGGVPLRLPIARTLMLLFSFLQPVKPWGTFLTRRKADLSFNFFRLLKKWSILTIDHCKKTRTFYVILISSVELVKKICGILDHYITLKCTNEKN